MDHNRTHRRHRRHGMRMRQGAEERGEGSRFGPPFGGRRRGRLMRDFFAENPECAEKMARFGVAKMREDGLSDDEIREQITHMRGRSFAPDLDIDDLLA